MKEKKIKIQIIADVGAARKGLQKLSDSFRQQIKESPHGFNPTLHSLDVELMKSLYIPPAKLNLTDEAAVRREVEKMAEARMTDAEIFETLEGFETNQPDEVVFLDEKSRQLCSKIIETFLPERPTQRKGYLLFAVISVLKNHSKRFFKNDLITYQKLLGYFNSRLNTDFKQVKEDSRGFKTTKKEIEAYVKNHI